jgi:putative hydrolase of the HAD superfamily
VQSEDAGLGLTDENQMKKANNVTTLFVDIGGVLLTDGWSHEFRKRAVKTFDLDLEEMERRNNQTYDMYESGNLTIEEYMDRIVFYKKRSFTSAQFRKFIFVQSKPYLQMIELIRRLKTRYGLKIVVVSNEARELNVYRIRKFKLDTFVDIFISSCFIHIRKPDVKIFHLALDIAQTPARNVVYIENTPMFVRIAEGLGIRSILHTDYASTCVKLASFGLKNGK